MIPPWLVCLIATAIRFVWLAVFVAAAPIAAALLVFILPVSLAIHCHEGAHA